MDRKSFENKPFQNPNLHSIWAEYFPRYVRMGLIGAVVVSAVVWAHNKYSNNPAEIEPNQDQSETHDPEA